MLLNYEPADHDVIQDQENLTIDFLSFWENFMGSS
jgi:hypothetical protein